MPIIPSSIIALDVGAKRVGVASASLIARLPRPLTTLTQDENFFSELQKLIDSEEPAAIVVGLPRGLDGQHTAQTVASENFVDKLRQHTDLPVHFQDEALTSVKAKDELEARRKPYQRGDVDALAATYILSDFLADPRNTQELKT